jgi:hypothetical protein
MFANYCVVSGPDFNASPFAFIKNSNLPIGTVNLINATHLAVYDTYNTVIKVRLYSMDTITYDLRVQPCHTTRNKAFHGSLHMCYLFAVLCFEFTPIFRNTDLMP